MFRWNPIREDKKSDCDSKSIDLTCTSMICLTCSTRLDNFKRLNWSKPDPTPPKINRTKIRHTRSNLTRSGPRSSWSEYDCTRPIVTFMNDHYWFDLKSIIWLKKYDKNIIMFLYIPQYISFPYFIYKICCWKYNQNFLILFLIYLMVKIN